MTKEITKAYILQQLEDKLGMREFTPANFLFDETVIPVYDIKPHLEKWKSDFMTASITGIDVFDLFEVPENEKWTLWRYDVVFMSGVFTIAGLYTRRHDMSSLDFCYLDLGAAKSTSYHIGLPVPLVLAAGDKIIVNVDGYTSTGNLRVYIDYMVEEIR